MKKIISQEVIENFLHGSDPEQYIVGVEYDYKTDHIIKIIQDPQKGKIIKQDTMTSFLWVGDLSEFNFYNNSKELQKKKMGEYGILITPLDTYDNERLEKGMKYLVKSLKGQQALMSFFKQGGVDPWGEKFKKHFIVLTPVEQYLIQKKKRLFKGIENYSDVHRLVFDIETTGLNPDIDKIILIGVKSNMGLRKTFSSFGEYGEEGCIREFFKIIKETKPTIIGGYNSASFDFPFILRRAVLLGMDVKHLTQIISLEGIKVRDGILKLANEVEPYQQFILSGFNIIDISHSVRRAQAINSEIKSWGLKYITKYLEKEKPNRIYVDGSKISKIYLDNENYYVNPKTGGYRRFGEPGTENLLEKFPNKFETWSGKKLIEQYLDDDLYETMIVDDSFSQSTFLLSKLIPTTYERVATMGTATLWKLIMLAWSYENNIAIPVKAERRKITGGLSRLLNVGYAKNIVKFDYASLYPSIQLVYDVFPDCDVMGVQKSMLKYFRDIRIKYKHLASELKDSDPELSEMYDRKQLPIKIFINAYFGSLSAPQVFPWGDMDMGETITCTGRQFLRMMLMFFSKRNYKPLVMDSVEYDTPVYLKDENDNLRILSISDLFNEKSEYLDPEGLRDFEDKKYKILTKNGWKNIKYVYRHETTKPIHKLVTKDRLVCCTSDHSIYVDGIKIKPTDVKVNDYIDIVDIPTLNDKKFTENQIIELLKGNEKIPKEILNADNDSIVLFFNILEKDIKSYCDDTFTKSELSSILYLKNKIGDEQNIIFDDNHIYLFSESKHKINDVEITETNKLKFNQPISITKKYVYDISTEDGTFVGGIGGILLSNTDGVNFESPSDVETHTYVGKGYNELVVKDKTYTGVEADIAEFNDIFMRNEMGLDIDYFAPACINVSRKNYIIKIIKKGKEKIKLTGNTIKSKKLAQYIVDFLDIGLKYLLDGDGLSFINLYYDYIDKLYNKQIPLVKIANKARVKQSVEDYKKYIKKTNKGGSLMSRQAHMELIMLNNYPATLGETIYYVNNGTKASQGDVQKVKKYEQEWTKEEIKQYKIDNGKLPPKIDVIDINSYMILESDINNNPNLTGDYNVPRYIRNFNKRVEPLLVVFNPEIRESILISDPKDRSFFTEKQCELDHGHPLKEGGQDKIEEVMTLSESEVEFWNRVNRDPYFMYVDDSIKLVDQHWVEHNRKVLKKLEDSIKNNEDEEIIDNDARDYAFHATNV